MSANILNGKSVSEPILQEITQNLNKRLLQGLTPPTLAVILIGNDPASIVYVKHKILACEKVGIISRLFKLAENISQLELLALIKELNNDPKIHGILVQLPLPNSIKTQDILTAINICKDVDGFHPANLGSLTQGWPLLQPCTPLGIMKLLATTNINLQGQHAVVVGSSNIVGKPVGLLLLNAGCTVTICNQYVKNLADLAKTADILISATGKPGLIKGQWIKPQSIIIDVGIAKVNNKILGDVEFEEAKKRASWITKVPGGVGPMTIAYLLKNTILAQELCETKQT